MDVTDELTKIYPNKDVQRVREYIVVTDKDDPSTAALIDMLKVKNSCLESKHLIEPIPISWSYPKVEQAVMQGVRAKSHYVLKTESETKDSN
jgi:hypothetical protein